MLKRIILSVMAVALAFSVGSAREIAGVNLPDSFTVGQDNLILSGAGLREKYALGVDVYVAGLYLKAKSSNALQIINADESMALRLQMVRSVNAKDFSDNTHAGFQESTKNLGIDIKSIDKEINQFLEVFKDSINNKDIFDITYSKANGVQVYKNKALKVTIKNLVLKKALFGIWLTNRSEDKLNVLREGLLGK